MSKEETPKVTCTGTIKIEGTEIDCHFLDDGRNVIEKEQLAEFLELLAVKFTNNAE